MDIAIGSFAEPQRNNADISAKEVISRVMSKAEIKKQALKSNNKDYLLDFIEEKPVKEYSKEPESTMLNLDFKKKKSQKEVVGGSKNSSSTGLDFLKDTSISTEIYLDKLMSHINNLKVISSSKISLHQNTGINELNKLNNAFESLKTQLMEIQNCVKSQNKYIPSSRNQSKTPTRIIQEKPQRIDSSPSPLIQRRKNGNYTFSSSPRNLKVQNPNSKILLNIRNQSQKFETQGPKLQNAEPFMSHKILSKPVMSQNFIHNQQRYQPKLQVQKSPPAKVITGNKIVSSSAHNLPIPNSNQQNNYHHQAMNFSKNSPQIISTPILQQLPARKVGTPVSVRRRLDSSTPSQRIRLDGTLTNNRVMGFSSRPSSRTNNVSNQQGGTQSYTPRNYSGNRNDTFSQKVGLRLKSSSRNSP